MKFKKEGECMLEKFKKIKPSDSKNIPLLFVFESEELLENIHQSGDGLDVNCPFCEGKRKLHINPEKNVWRCNKCNESGNAVTLYAKLHGVSTKDAYRTIKEQYFGVDIKKRTEIEQKSKTKQRRELAPLLVRSSVYDRLVSECTLSQVHRNKLKERGLTDEQINQFKFRSVPIVGMKTVSDKVMLVDTEFPSTQYLKLKNWQVPGFYTTKDGDTRIVKTDSGILIPVVWYNGLISCFQIRFDDNDKKENFVRYKYLSSSGLKDGVSVTGGDNIHFVGFDFSKYETPEVVTLTEGALKADVASALSGNKPFIAVLGVNAQSKLDEALQYLKEHGTKTINIAFDMDYQDKPEVARALKSVEEKVKNAGLTPKKLVWDKKYKGIDDFLKSKADIGL